MPTRQDCIRILLVEDSAADVLLMKEALGDMSCLRFQITETQTLEAARSALAAEAFDIVLLDLGLPDSRGLDTFRSFRESAEVIPVLIITALEDETLAIQAVQLGAQDFLVKSEVQRSLLGRFIRFAIERHRLQQELSSVRERQQREREVESMERMSSSKVVTSVTSGIYSGKPLHEGAPEDFSEILQRYEELLDLAFENRIHRNDAELTESIRQLASYLGFLKAGPRDVIDVHTQALRGKTSHQVPIVKVQAIHEEGRMLVLELMGTLASYYRSLTVGHYAKETFHEYH